MQLRHVSTNLRQGLRRNLSMSAAVVLTLFVSLTLAGVGVMLSKQSEFTVDALSSELEVQVTLCVPDEAQFPQCTSEVTPEQKAAVLAAVDDSPDVVDVREESKAEGLEKLKELYGPELFEGPDPVFDVEDVPETIWIQLEDPAEDEAVVSAVEDLDGVRDVVPPEEQVGSIVTLIDDLETSAYVVAGVLLLAAVLMVANTIRLAALARRREIEIMRLVGASRIFIALPFLLEALVLALLGVLFAAGALAAFTKFIVIDRIADRIGGVPVVAWPEYLLAVVVIAIAGAVLTVLPTLLLTRKYLRY
ncbi:permease-like cell division protein FtsX [Nocardioides marinquilinus]|uniref:Cell division protein FtsX n=1 Tax=Nocardioides marinquilinus TaxID=1210400 RepID=A0ABP9PLP6_9ACTN